MRRKFTAKFLRNCRLKIVKIFPVKFRDKFIKIRKTALSYYCFGFRLGSRFGFGLGFGFGSPSYFISVHGTKKDCRAGVFHVYYYYCAVFLLNEHISDIFALLFAVIIISQSFSVLVIFGVFIFLCLKVACGKAYLKGKFIKFAVLFRLSAHFAVFIRKFAYLIVKIFHGCPRLGFDGKIIAEQGIYFAHRGDLCYLHLRGLFDACAQKRGGSRHYRQKHNKKKTLHFHNFRLIIIFTIL